MSGAADWRTNRDSSPATGWSASKGGRSRNSESLFSPQFEPGTRWEYSNYGFLLLGVVIERVSGQSSYDYVRQNICRPSKGGVQFFGFGGGAPGMNGELRVYPESGTVITVLSNLDPPAATRVADWLEQRLPGMLNARPTAENRPHDATEVADTHSVLRLPARAQQSLRAVDLPSLPVTFFPVATSVAAIGESLPDRSRQYNQSG